MKRKLAYVLTVSVLLTSCTTTQNMELPNNFKLESPKAARSIEEEEQLNEADEKNFLTQEELKVQDVEETVVYVDRPVYVPEQHDNPETENKKLTGYDAVTDSQKRATQKPEHYKSGTFFYQFNDNFVFEVYVQPYHLTDIVLEEGEVVIGTPLLSEDESVWELTAGVAKNPITGKDVQHLFVKPAYSKQDSSLVIITDRRVYHFRLRSFSDTHMAMVKFSYPLEKNVWAKKEDPNKGREIISDYLRVSNPELLSFDYKIKYSRFKKPEFLPNRIYDDGQCTYIQVEPVVLQKKLPVLFNEKNEIVNYSVHKNTFVIPRLINKITLRLGKEKVVVEKKVTKKTDLEKTEPTEESEAGGDE